MIDPANPYRLTPHMMLALRQGLASGRIQPGINRSTLKSLRGRGLVRDDLTLSPEAMAIARGEAQNIIPCSKCGQPTNQLYTMATGYELCGSCGRRNPAQPSTRKETSSGPDVRYHGDYQ